MLVCELSKWVEKAKVNKYITFHCFMHTFVIRLLGRCVDIYTIASLPGQNMQPIRRFMQELVKRTSESEKLFRKFNTSRACQKQTRPDCHRLPVSFLSSWSIIVILLRKKPVQYRLYMNNSSFDFHVPGLYKSDQRKVSALKNIWGCNESRCLTLEGLGGSILKSTSISSSARLFSQTTKSTSMSLGPGL